VNTQASRKPELTTEQAIERARANLKDAPGDLVEEIYKEGFNVDQPDSDRIAKVLLKWSALAAVLSDEQERSTRRVIVLT